MKLHWKGFGRTGRINSDLKVIYLEWNRIDGFNTYYLFSKNADGKVKRILNFRIPDYQWQDTEPKLFSEPTILIQTREEFDKLP